jgi:hypothetical protein
MNGKTTDNSVIKAMDTELGDHGFISGCGRTRFSPLPRITCWFCSPLRHPLKSVGTFCMDKAN